jgi:hypothetical protein
MSTELLATQGAALETVTTEAQAIHFLGFLHWAKTDILFGLGDWILHCEKQFGRDWVNGQLEQSEFGFEEASKAYAVACAIPRGKRRPGLSFEHHAVATRAEQPELALEWAQQQGLTAAELAHSIRVKVQLTKAEIREQRDRLAVVSPVSIAERFSKWLTHVPREKWTRTDKEQILADLRPLAEFIRSLEAEL